MVASQLNHQIISLAKRPLTHYWISPLTRNCEALFLFAYSCDFCWLSSDLNHFDIVSLTHRALKSTSERFTCFVIVSEVFRKCHWGWRRADKSVISRYLVMILISFCTFQLFGVFLHEVTSLSLWHFDKLYIEHSWMTLMDDINNTKNILFLHLDSVFSFCRNCQHIDKEIYRYRSIEIDW